MSFGINPNLLKRVWQSTKEVNMDKNDLLINLEPDGQYANYPASRPATEKDLRARGYVKLDRDRIAHALMVESWQHEGADLYPSPEGWYPFADRVLAALDGETTI